MHLFSTDKGIARRSDTPAMKLSCLTRSMTICTRRSWRAPSMRCALHGIG